MTDRHTTNTTPALTPEREAEIRKRAEAEHLTASPWRLEYESCDCGGDYACGHGLYPSAVVTKDPTLFAAERAKRTGEAPRDYDFHRTEMSDFTRADWELMAHAREDVPVLLAELDRVRAERDEALARVAEAVCICGHPEQQHFEDVCQTCGCGDYLEPEAAREVIARWRESATRTPADDLPARLEAALTERFTELGNPFSEMRHQEEGPDGWPASRPVGPHKVAELLRELLRRPAA